MRWIMCAVVILHPTRRIYLFCLQCHSQHWWRLGHAWNSGMSTLRAGYITYALSKPNKFHTSEKLHHSYYSLLQLFLMYWWNRTHGSHDADQRVPHPFAADGRGVPHCATLHDPGTPLIQHFQTNHTICWEMFPSLQLLKHPAFITCSNILQVMEAEDVISWEQGNRGLTALPQLWFRLTMIHAEVRGWCCGEFRNDTSYSKWYPYSQAPPLSTKPAFCHSASYWMQQN